MVIPVLFVLLAQAALLNVQAKSQLDRPVVLDPNCVSACDEITRLLPGHTHHHDAAKVPLWSLFQARASPACRVQPHSASQIAAILGVVREKQCRFAILGGGTAPFRGSSNVEGGVTIDLQLMNDVRLSYPNEIGNEGAAVHVGGGARWADVYTLLDPLNMSAVGTRNTTDDEILQGGISFFSQGHGWSCDSVIEFEIVLANGSVVMASEWANPDLFWALRGGGSNYGIVSRVTIDAFPQHPSLYKFRRWHTSSFDRVFQRLDSFARAMPLNMQMIATTLAWSARLGDFVTSERIVISQHQQADDSVDVVLGRETAVVERDEHKVQEKPLASDLTSILEEHSYSRTSLQMSQVMDHVNEAGYFNYFGSITIRSNPGLSQRIAVIFQEEVQNILDVAGVKAYIVYNPLTVDTMRQMKRRGGNTLGLDSEEPLIIINLNMHWSSEEEIPRMTSFIETLLARFTEVAKAFELHHPYIFLNHCFETQQAMLGYGRRTLEKLHKVREAFDPDGVFQRLQEAHHRLGPLLKEQDDPRFIKTEL
ncbi:putative Bifunctional solanapyrone synthase [Seiridium cardinale]